MLYKLFIFGFVFLITNINAFKFGNFKGCTKRFAVNLFYPQNDMKQLHYLQSYAISNIWLNKVNENYDSCNKINNLNYNIKNDINKKYLAFVPSLIDNDECSETLCILVYSIINRAQNDNIVCVDKLIISPYWRESQIKLRTIKNAYYRYFKEQLNIKYIYLL